VVEEDWFSAHAIRAISRKQSDSVALKKKVDNEREHIMVLVSHEAVHLKWQWCLLVRGRVTSGCMLKLTPIRMTKL
jgi:hypothetical protein